MKSPEVDKYIAAQPKEMQPLLKQMRETIRKAAPDAEETISYSMPAFKQNGILVYYAAWKNHIGFYPTSSPQKVFKKELEKYSPTKGTVRFSADEPLPVDLITRIVKYRVQENQAKKEAKKIQK